MSERQEVVKNQPMTDLEMCDVAEANIRADYANGVIDGKRFRMEMFIVCRSRVEAKRQVAP